MPPRDLNLLPTSDPAEDISRRRILTALPVFTLLAAGVSCGDDDETPAGARAMPAPGYPREVADASRTVTLQALPARIVTITNTYDLDAVLALGSRRCRWA